MTRPHYYYLNPSSLTVLREKHGLTMEALSKRTEFSVLQIARLEKYSQRIPAKVWRAFEAAVSPPAGGSVQLSIFDYLSAAKGEGSHE
jgi:hypothetical protein